MPLTKYRPEFGPQLVAYGYEGKRTPGCFPTLKKWAARTGVSLATVRSWRAAHPDFEQACQTFREMQKATIFHRGMTGQMPYPQAARLARQFMGWRI